MSFLLAVFLWQPLQTQILHYLQDKQESASSLIALDKACRHSLQAQSKHVLISRRASETIREIWQLQPTLEYRHPRYIHKTLAQANFRAAYDLLLLREQAGEPLQKISRCWTDFITTDPQQQDIMISKLKKK